MRNRVFEVGLYQSLDVVVHVKTHRSRLGFDGWPQFWSEPKEELGFPFFSGLFFDFG